MLIELAYQRFIVIREDIVISADSHKNEWKSHVPDHIRYIRISPFSRIDIIDFIEVFDFMDLPPGSQ